MAGSISTLEELRLDSNQLTSLPSSIQNWKILKIFTASENSIQSKIFLENVFNCFMVVLPEEAREWTQIVHLSLRKNQLAEISPRIFTTWSKVQKIILSFNRLVELPETINFCASLTELDVCGNMITTIPETLRFCRNLKRLNIGE